LPVIKGQPCLYEEYKFRSFSIAYLLSIDDLLPQLEEIFKYIAPNNQTKMQCWFLSSKIIAVSP